MEGGNHECPEQESYNKYFWRKKITPRFDRCRLPEIIPNGLLMSCWVFQESVLALKHSKDKINYLCKALLGKNTQLGWPWKHLMLKSQRPTSADLCKDCLNPWLWQLFHNYTAAQIFTLIHSLLVCFCFSSSSAQSFQGRMHSALLLCTCKIPSEFFTTASAAIIPLSNEQCGYFETHFKWNI